MKRSTASIHLQSLHLLLALVLGPFLPTTSAQSDDNSTFPKRGLIYIGTDHPDDVRVFTRPNSPLTWYYNYSPWPATSLAEWSTEFAPMVHSAAEAPAAVDTIKAVLNGSAGVRVASSSSQQGRSGGGGGNSITHVLSFNEPDGDTQSGGSDATPRAAAQAYLTHIAPLRAAPWNLQVSLPATTGSPRGLQWLRDFNASCHSLNPASGGNSSGGCEFDFIATHWYGDFAALASWLGSLHAMYPSAPIWLTEFGVAGLSADETTAILNTSLPYLDGLDYLDRYAWFGTFRNDDANEWTGDGVSMLDSRGRLTELGAQYLGGDEDGFEEGMGGGAVGSVTWSGWLVAMLSLVWLGYLL